MASYYADINNSYSGTGHLGTIGDPFSISDLISHSQANPSGNHYYIKGQYIDGTDNPVHLYIYSNTWDSWDPEINGSWIYRRSGSFNTVLYLDMNSDGLIKDAIILNDQNTIRTFSNNVNCIFADSVAAIYPDNGSSKGSTYCVSPIFQGSITHSFQDCTFTVAGASISGSGNLISFTNCRMGNVVGDIGQYTITNCQLTPQMVSPDLSGSKNGNQVDLLSSDMLTPPEPGNPPYTDYDKGLWGSSRTGIGAMYFGPMEPYWVKASGSNTWPFDTEEKAAPTFDALFIGLDDNSVDLVASDIVNVRGAINEIVVSDYIFECNGALIQGLDSRTEVIYLYDNNWFEVGRFLNLHIWTDKPAAGLLIIDAIEVKHCRMGYTGPDTAFELISNGSTTTNTEIVNNLFYGSSSTANVKVSIWSGTSSNVDYVILENNTFDRVGVITMDFHGVPTLTLIKIRNNIYKGHPSHSGGILIDFDICGGTNVVEFLHDHNCVYSYTSDTYRYQSCSDPPIPVIIPPDITEIVADPLFVGSGSEPYRLRPESPARHTGYHYLDSPTDDLVGIVRPDPPSMGAFEDYYSYSYSLSRSVLKNGIIFATSEIKNIHTCYDMLFIASNIRGRFIVKGCSFYGNVY